MNREKILLEVLNEHGDFENVRQQFNENDLAVITESMLRFAKLGQTLHIDNVIVPKDTLLPVFLKGVVLQKKPNTQE